MQVFIKLNDKGKEASDKAKTLVKIVTALIDFAYLGEKEGTLVFDAPDISEFPEERKNKLENLL